MEECKFCGDKKCEGCPLPYTDKIKYEELLSRMKILGNESFFIDNYSSRGRNEIILEMAWAKSVKMDVFAPFNQAKEYKK